MGLFGFNMNHLKINKFFDIVMALEEAEELVAISEAQFLTKLQALEKQISQSCTDQEKKAVKHQAFRLYEDYKKTLQEIESFIRDTCS